MQIEPNVPLALRRLRHAEYFAFMSRGNFASIDETTSSLLLNNPQQSTNLLSGNASPAFHLGAASSSTFSGTSFRSFFPFETSCCRMEVLVNGVAGNGNEERQPFLLYRSEPVAPSRHPRFGPLSADVRAIGETIDNVIIRVLAEREESRSATYCTVDHTPDPTSFANNNSIAIVMPSTRTRGSSTIQAATACVTEFFADDDDDEDFAHNKHQLQQQQRRRAGTTAASSGVAHSLFHLNPAELSMNHNHNQQHLVVTSANANTPSPTNRDITTATNHNNNANFENTLPSRLMKEFQIDFSCLEYVADTLSDATEVLRYRFRHNQTSVQQQQQNQQSTSVSTDDNNVSDMECLIVCHDGVFIPSKDPTLKTTFAQLSSVEKLKRFGHERSFTAGTNSSTSPASISGLGSPRDQQGGTWDVVIEKQEADKMDTFSLEAMVNTTMTLHFAEKVLKQRAFLEKKRLIEKAKVEMKEVSAASTSSTSNNEGQQQQQQPQHQSNSLRRELTQGYRQIELEDLRRQVETLNTQLNQQNILADLLQEQLKGRQLALEGRRREVDEKSSRLKQIKAAATDDLDSAAKLEKQLRLCRSKVLSGMVRLFPITVAGSHTICGFNIPHNEPQNENHACALGCIVHAVVTFCAVHGHVPLHPLQSMTSRSSVAEYVGAPASKVFPLYATNATEREASKQAVVLLRRVMAHSAFAIHNQRQANDLPLGIALQKLLFNR